LTGRWECECECEVVVQALSSVSDCGCEVESIAITREATLGDLCAETRDSVASAKGYGQRCGINEKFRNN
jgi:hypothetical protein